MQLTQPTSGQKSRFSYPANGLDSLSLASLACRLKTTAEIKQAPLVIITSNASDAQRLLEELPYFAPNLR